MYSFRPRIPSKLLCVCQICDKPAEIHVFELINTLFYKNVLQTCALSFLRRDIGGAAKLAVSFFLRNCTTSQRQTRTTMPQHNSLKFAYSLYLICFQSSIQQTNNNYELKIGEQIIGKGFRKISHKFFTWWGFPTTFRIHKHSAKYVQGINNNSLTNGVQTRGQKLIASE